MKTHLVGNEHQWIIETEYDNWTAFHFNFDKSIFGKREDVSDRTSTYRGLQHDVPKQCFINHDEVVDWINNKFKEVNLPYQVDKFCAAWVINYKKGGWQKMHRHGPADEKKISVIFYLTDTDERHGATFAVLYDGDGNTHDLCYDKQVAGDALIFKSTVLHGAYPTRTMKNVFVADFYYKEIDNNS